MTFENPMIALKVTHPNGAIFNFEEAEVNSNPDDFIVFPANSVFGDLGITNVLGIGEQLGFEVNLVFGQTETLSDQVQFIGGVFYGLDLLLEKEDDLELGETLESGCTIEDEMGNAADEIDAGDTLTCRVTIDTTERTLEDNLEVEQSMPEGLVPDTNMDGNVTVEDFTVEGFVGTNTPIIDFDAIAETLTLTFNSGYVIEPQSGFSDGDEIIITYNVQVNDVSNLSENITIETDISNGNELPSPPTCNYNLTLNTLSINNPQYLKTSIAPNPFNETLTILNAAELQKADIYDLKGALIKRFKKNSTQINTSDLASGFYIIKIYTKTNQTNFKVIKE